MLKAFHRTSLNGIDHWLFRAGLRPGNRPHPLYRRQEGRVAHFIFVALDQPKDLEIADDFHGRKTVIVPFDGKALDLAITEIMKRERDNGDSKYRK